MKAERVKLLEQVKTGQGDSEDSEMARMRTEYDKMKNIVLALKSERESITFVEFFLCFHCSPSMLCC